MKKILVIEDAPRLLRVLEKNLPFKYEVIVMNSALDAWTFLSDGNECDLIISELKIQSTQTVELLGTINNSDLLKHISVIIHSGLDESMPGECKTIA